MSSESTWENIEELKLLFAATEYKDDPSILFRVCGAMEMELEFCELLYSLVRARKPRLVLEGGTGYGVSAYFIGTALKENGIGRCITYEIAEDFFRLAERNLRNLPVEVRMGSTLDYSGEQPELLFLDSRSDARTKEIEYWRGKRILSMIHDARRYGDVVNQGILFDSYRSCWIGLL